MTGDGEGAVADYLECLEYAIAGGDGVVEYRDRRFRFVYQIAVYPGLCIDEL